MKGSARGKNRNLRNLALLSTDPGRAQYLIEAMRAGRCPDCQAGLIAAYDPGLEDVIESGTRILECPRCQWQGELDDRGEIPLEGE